MRLTFSVGDKRKCYNYTIQDDTNCELGEMETIFKSRLTLITTDDIGLKRNSSHVVATVTIDDRAEPECCKSHIGKWEQPSCYNPWRMAFMYKQQIHCIVCQKGLFISMPMQLGIDIECNILLHILTSTSGKINEGGCQITKNKGKKKMLSSTKT